MQEERRRRCEDLEDHIECHMGLERFGKLWSSKRCKRFQTDDQHDLSMTTHRILQATSSLLFRRFVGYRSKGVEKY